MIYMHVLNLGGRGVRSPIDGRSAGGPTDCMLAVMLLDAIWR